MSEKAPFPGGGFSREPFTEDELAKHRQAHSKLTDAWPTIEGVDQLSKGAKRLAVVGGVAAGVGVVVAYLVKQGLI